MVNSTSDWDFTDRTRYPGKAVPDSYFVNGTLPSGEPEGYVTCGFRSTDSSFAMVGNSISGENVFAIAAGYIYATFDKVQCTVDFVPTSFVVAVNRIDRLISVSAQANGPKANKMEPNGAAVQIARRMLTSFSQQHGCDLYTSLFGNTFKQ